MNLLDGWKKCGNDPDVFTSEIKNLTDSTVYRRANTADLMMLVPRYETSSHYMMQVINPEVLRDVSDTAEFAKDVSVEKDKLNRLLLNEAKEVGFLLADESVYFVSRYALSSLFARAEINGAGLFHNTFARNLLLEERLFETGLDYNENCTMVIRNAHNQKKIFFMPSEKYVPIPLTVLSDAMYLLFDAYGRGQVKEWKITHFVSEVAIVYPDLKAETDVLPGILLRSSDTGQACLEVDVIAYVGGTRVTLLERKWKHYSDTTPEALARIAVSEFDSVIPDFSRRLAALADKRIADTRHKKEARKMSMRLIRHAKLSDVLGKRREKRFRELIEEKIDNAESYSALDLCFDILSVRDVFDEVPKTVDDKLASCFGTVIWQMLSEEK